MTPRSAQEIILVANDDERLGKLILAALQSAGYEVTLAGNGAAALEQVAEATPDLIIAEVMMPEMDGLELLRRLRADAATRAIPVIMLADKDADDAVVDSLYLGADDCLPQPLEMAELLARVRARIARPPLPRELLLRDPQTGLLSERSFFEEVERELARRRRRGPGIRRASGGCLAYLELDGPPEPRERPEARVKEEIARQVAALLSADADPLEVVGRDTEGRFALLMPKQSTGTARRRLKQLCDQITARSFAAGGEWVRLAPVIGHAPLSPTVSGEELRQQALRAVEGARQQLALNPARHRSALIAQSNATPRAAGRAWVALRKPARTSYQVLLSFLAGLMALFLLSIAWGAAR